MSKRFITSSNYFTVVDTETSVEEIREAKDNITYKDNNGSISFYLKSGIKKSVTDYVLTNVVNGNKNDTPFADFAELKAYLDISTALKEVFVQDQHSPVIIASMSLLEQETLLTTTVAIDDRTITVDDPTGFTVGKYISIFNVAANRFYLGTVLSTSGNPVTLDTRMDFAYPSGSFVTSGSKNMNVNGSVTPVIFGLRNTDVAIGASFDITQLRITCLTTNPVDLSKFGDIVGGIPNGLILRRVDGETRNIFNVKTNREISNIMKYDPQSAINPAQGQDGFISILKFAGQSEVGVTLRLAPGEDIQIVNQDALQTLLSLEVVVEGHEVVD